MKRLALLFSVFAATATPAAVSAGDVDFTGFIGTELRIFQHDAADSMQNDGRLAPSMTIQPEIRYDISADDRLTIIPFARWDRRDSERRHVDLREFNWSRIGDGWDVRVGLDKVFWGVTESHHLVDVINQTDLVEAMDGEDKLGQPMVNLGLQRDWGNLNLFVMPWFRERTFPGAKGRLRSVPLVDADEAVYVGNADQNHLDMALRYSTVVGDWDIGLSHFHGVGREPALVSGTNAAGETVFIPHYQVIDQTGLDLQTTKGAWLWKLETIVRSGDGSRFAAFVGGIEYTFYDVAETGVDLGLIAEYQYDGRDAGAPPVIQDNDIVLGFRLAFNDTDDSSLLAGVAIDHETGARWMTLEAETRLTDVWNLELEAMANGNLGAGEPGYGTRQDDHLALNLKRYF